jgi:ABC-type branched-subunit amino acid transport system substrate-binding protein
MRAYLLYGSMLIGACSAIVDDSTQQCKATTDCAALGAEFANMTCQQSVCVPPAGEKAECQSNDDCVARGSTFKCSAAKTCVKGCTKHSECTTRLGMASVCRTDGECAALYSADCDAVIPAGAEKGDDMYLIGFMGIVKGEDASYGLAQKEGEALALLDIQNSLVKLDGATPGDPKRNLTMLVCNHGAGLGDAPANHLVNELQVPAILGASYSSVTANVVSIAAARNVLVFSPAATSPILTNDNGTDLFWRTVPSDVVQTGALKQLVPLVAKTLRDRGVLAAGQQPVVALPWKDDAAGNGLYVGSSTGADAVSGTPFRYDAAMLESSPVYRMARAQEIVALKPHIILHLGTGEFIQFVVPLIEQLWVGNDRPWYIVPEGDLEKLKEKGASEQLITTNNLSARLVGTSPGGRRSEAYRQFKDRFQGEPGNLAEFAYDAVYALAYAIGATGKQQPSGLELAMGLRKTTCKTGPRIGAGTSDFSNGWKAARAGCLDYYGPSGEVDFDMNGDTESDISVGCFQKTGDAYAFVRMDTYYPISQRKLTPWKGAALDFSTPTWCTALAP